MTISLSDTGKRYNREWIFRGFSYHFNSGISYAITGPNGSGKSTLLQVIAGAVGHSAGSIRYTAEDVVIDPENMYRFLSIAAPYLELIEEMTSREFLQFHNGFKPLRKQYTIEQMLDLVGLGKAADKQIRYYSSGMKQRVKLAQAIFSDTPLLLLDEPCTNLDANGIELYQELISLHTREKLVIVSSNDPQEYGFCHEVLSVMDYK